MKTQEQQLHELHELLSEWREAYELMPSSTSGRATFWGQMVELAAILEPGSTEVDEHAAGESIDKAIEEIAEDENP